MKKYIAIIIVTILIAGNVSAIVRPVGYGETIPIAHYLCGGQAYYSSEDSGYIRCKEKAKEEREEESERQKEEAKEKAEQEEKEREESIIDLIEDETEDLRDKAEELEVQNEYKTEYSKYLETKIEKLEVQNEELSNRITANKRNQDSILWLVRKILEIMNFTQ